MTGSCVWTPDVSAYLLGALSDSERAAFSKHIQSCDVCREEVANLRSAAAAMPLAVEHHEAPPELKASLMATVRAEAELLRAAGAEADRPAPARAKRSWFRIAAPVATALAVAVLAVVGVQSFTGDDSPATVQTIEAQVSLPQGAAHVELLSADHARLVLDGVPPPPAGHVYEMWLAGEDGKPVPAGTIEQVRADGATITDVDGDLSRANKLLVTIEKAPGTTAPTATPVLQSNLS